MNPTPAEWWGGPFDGAEVVVTSDVVRIAYTPPPSAHPADKVRSRVLECAVVRRADGRLIVVWQEPLQQ